MKKSMSLIFVLLALMLVSLMVLGAAPLKEGDANTPGEPGWISFFWEDEISENVNGKNLNTFGDAFFKNVFERPFTAEEMVYQAELDIVQAEVTNDDGLYYFYGSVE